MPRQPLVVWLDAGGTNQPALAAIYSVFLPDEATFLPLADRTTDQLAARLQDYGLIIFACNVAVAADLTTRLADLTPYRQALGGRRAALILSSVQHNQPQPELQEKLAESIKKAGFIYLGAFWHYAGGHAGWLLQNKPKAANFKARLAFEDQTMLQMSKH